MTILEYLALLISGCSAITCFLTLLHHIRISYTRIEVHNFKENENLFNQFVFKYFDEDKATYLFAKVHVENFSPTVGSVFNFTLKAKDRTYYAPLTKEQLKQTSQTFQTDLKTFADGAEYFNKQAIIESFKENIIVVAFRVAPGLLDCDAKKYIFSLDYYDVERRTIQTKFKLTPENCTGYESIDDYVFLANIIFYSDFKIKRFNKK